MDGYVARHDDPIWGQWTPSCGHRCRRIALTADQAVLIQSPDPGWGHDPFTRTGSYSTATAIPR
jgi:hypothetical protein